MRRVIPVGQEIAAVVAGWRRADERLFPLVMVDPQRYTRVVSVIRDTADRLDGCETVEDLVRARQRGRDLVALSCAAAGVPAEGLADVEAVADAAFALRHREIATTLRRRRIAATILAARERRDPWVTIDEVGDRHHPGEVGYERVDMRVADGVGIRATVAVDPDTYRRVYSVEPVRLDPATGVVLERSADADTFTDRTSWRAAVARWRGDVAGHRDGP